MLLGALNRLRGASGASRRMIGGEIWRDIHCRFVIWLELGFIVFSAVNCTLNLKLTRHISRVG